MGLGNFGLIGLFHGEYWEEFTSGMVGAGCIGRLEGGFSRLNVRFSR